MDQKNVMTTRQKTRVKAIVPFEVFEAEFSKLNRNTTCNRSWCPYARVACRMRTVREHLRSWWNEANGAAPGFEHYQKVIRTARDYDTKLYWGFWGERGASCQEVYDELVDQLRKAFSGEPLDCTRRYGWRE